jgi:hypothetical protein
LLRRCEGYDNQAEEKNAQGPAFHKPAEFCCRVNGNTKISVFGTAVQRNSKVRGPKCGFK